MLKEIKIFNLQTNLKILDFSDKNSDQNLMLKIPNLSVIHLLLKTAMPLATALEILLVSLFLPLFLY